MKKFFFLLSLIALIGACGTKKIVEVKPEVKLPQPILTKVDSISYAFGLSVAETFIKIKDDTDGEVNLDVDLFSEAIKEKLASNPRMSESELQSTMMSFSQDMQQKAQEKQARETIKSKEQGMKYLEANALKPGVETTASGLQYKVIKEGTGISPKAEDEVKVHYTGKLIDGSVFDSSVERGEPINFKLNGVIPGWTEGLQLMKEGAKFQFTIPSELAYGPNGTGGIPGGSVLIFDVELLEVVK